MKTVKYFLILSFLLWRSELAVGQSSELKTITFETFSDMNKVNEVNEPIKFIIKNTTEFKYANLKYYVNLPGFKENVQVLSISESKISGDYFLSLMFELRNLRELEVIKSELLGNMAPKKNISISSSITRITLEQSNFNQIILDYLLSDSLNLKHLTLKECSFKVDDKALSLKVDNLSKLKNSMILRGLEYLDLSGNALDNGLFSLFPMQMEGSLSTLILNDCQFTQEFRLSYYNQYTEVFPALSYTIHPEQPHVNWSSPFFKKLHRLEMFWIDKKSTIVADTVAVKRKVSQERDRQKKKFFYYIPKHAEALSLYLDTTLQKLEYFTGPVKTTDDGAFLYEILKISSLSRVLPVSVQSLTAYNKLITTGRAACLEELIFEGELWKEKQLSLALRPENFPDLKYVSIRNVRCSEKELENIIRRFPKYHFHISLYQNCIFVEPRVWPLVENENVKNK